MNASKLTKGSKAEGPGRHSASAPKSVQQPTVGRSEARKVARKATGERSKTANPKENAVRNSKLEKLVCRYCGSDDLAPSFIKRRDRRCRKCFSKRYGSPVRTKKTKVKK
jgi:hypothetical protein